MTSLQSAVTQYSNTFHHQVFKNLKTLKTSQDVSKALTQASKGNTIMSPLGAWLLGGMTTANDAGSYSPETVEFIEKTFGLTISEAFAAVEKLLATVPSSLTATAAAWVDERAGKKELSTWLTAVDEAGVETSTTVPDKKFLDEWVKRESLGLIKEFPFTPDSGTFIILATIIACKVTWFTPFESIPTPEKLSLWDTAEVLQSRTNHPGVILHNNKVYGVHIAAAPGMNVVSVIGEESEPAEEVLLTAMEIAADLSLVEKQSLQSISPQSGGFWSKHVEERTGYRVADRETITSLPAWSASGNYKLDDVEYGISSAGEVVRKCFLQETIQETVQVAVARFNRYGFEAAALTTSRVGSVSMPRLETKEVTVTTVDFSHPYAVVAVPQLRMSDNDSAWEGLPLFTAWVVEADEVDPVSPR